MPSGILYHRQFLIVFIEELHHALQLGLNAGVEIARHYRIMLGYDYGLLNRAKNMDSNVAHNQQFNIGVAYVF